jgi:hypothetical protein
VGVPRLLYSITLVVVGAATVGGQTADTNKSSGARLTVVPAWLDGPKPQNRPVGPTVDKDKLRAAVKLPETMMLFFMPVASRGDRAPTRARMFTKGQGQLDYAAAAAELQDRLNGSVQDAETYLDLAGCYVQLKDEERRQLAHRKADELLRP